MVFEMTGNAKKKILVLLGLVMIITVIIAASLPQLELQPGLPLPDIENNLVVIPPGDLVPSVTLQVSELVKVLLALICTGIILYYIYKLIRNVGWSNMRSYIKPFIVIALIIDIIIFLIMQLPAPQSDPQMELPLPMYTPPVRSPLGSVPSGLIWLVGIGMLISVIVFGIWIFAPSSRQKITTIDLVGLEAEKAWQELMTGLDWKGVIVKCYRQMSMALEKERGIEREDYMTTTEFENILESAGIPHDPIHQLTQLFEAVRYGNLQPNLLDEQKAINCLQAIMLYSNETKKTG
jgi:hypothetical protein